MRGGAISPVTPHEAEASRSRHSAPMFIRLARLSGSRSHGLPQGALRRTRLPRPLSGRMSHEHYRADEFVSALLRGLHEEFELLSMVGRVAAGARGGRHEHTAIIMSIGVAADDTGFAIPVENIYTDYG